MSDETHTPANDPQTSCEDAYSDSGSSPPGADDHSLPTSLDESQPLTNYPQAIAAHEAMSAYGEHVIFEPQSSLGPQSATVDAHEPMSGYGDSAPCDTESPAEPHPATLDPHGTMGSNEPARNCQGAQYKRRKELNREDLRTCPFPRQQLKADAEGLWRVVVPSISEESGFRFIPIADDAEEAQIAEIEDFIIRNEWLASLGQRTTHCFVVRTTPAKGDMLVAAVVMAVPPAFSKLLGDDTKVYETVIARGAVLSWAPAHLNSWLNARAIGWMVNNTPNRLFIGYGDPRANELGTIYQSLNAYYLGQEAGDDYELLDPDTGQVFSTRHPRHVSMYRRYAAEEGIPWKRTWTNGDGVEWRSVPSEIAVILRRKSKEYERRCIRRAAPPKHKYAIVRGATKTEQRDLRKRFEKINAAKIQDFPPEEQRGAHLPLGLRVRPKLLRLCDVKPEKVVWLWEHRIPFGSLTLLEGDPNVGKSLVACDLAARVSTGRPMPGDNAGRSPGGVVILSAEDGLADTIVPRLQVAGGELARVVSFSLEALPTIPDGLAEIERAITQVGAKLVIVDPLVAFFGDGIRATNDQKVRRALTPLTALAQRTGVAVLAIRHLTKNERAAAKYRGGGSIGLLGAARAVFLVAPHPSDSGCNVLVPVKTNLTTTPPAIAYRIVPASTVARIEWLDEVDCRAEDVLIARHQTNDRALLEAMEFLRTALANGERPATDVLREATEAGISEITLRRARKEMQVRVRREGFGKGSRLLLSLTDTPGASEKPEA